MMGVERLVEYSHTLNEAICVKANGCPELNKCWTCDFHIETLNTLCAYQDTGLTPEQVEEMKGELERIRRPGALVTWHADMHSGKPIPLLSLYPTREDADEAVGKSLNKPLLSGDIKNAIRLASYWVGTTNSDVNNIILDALIEKQIRDEEQAQQAMGEGRV